MVCCSVCLKKSASLSLVLVRSNAGAFQPNRGWVISYGQGQPLWAWLIDIELAAELVSCQFILLRQACRAPPGQEGHRIKTGQRQLDLFVDWLTKKNYVFISGCAGSSLLCGLFSSCREQELLCSCGAQTSHCGGFSCCRAQALRHMGFSSYIFRALESRLNSSASWA